MNSVWRLKTKPNGCTEDARRNLINAMLQDNFIATGWHIPNDPEDAQQYLEIAASAYGEKSIANMKRFIGKLAVDDFVWIVDTSGLFHLARVTGDWFYRRDDRNFDLYGVNRRQCEWVALNQSAADTPSGVRNALMQGVTFCRIRNYSALHVTNKLAGVITDEGGNNFLDLIGHDALEDLVGLFLQVRFGAVAIVSSCVRNTTAYEFVLKKRDGTGDIVAQVKSGAQRIDDNLAAVQAERFLFAVSGKYPDDLAGAQIIDRSELCDFAVQNQVLLPATVRVWMAP